MENRPNILFINTDQQTWDAVSAYGNTHIHTPGIDRLHRNGISFIKSYCTDPVCAPARASWVSGIYTSENGVCFNGGQMHEDIPDLGQVLNANGYYAAHCGKWHVDGRSMRDSFENLYYGKRDIGASLGEYYDRVSTHAVIDFIDSYDGSRPFYLQVGLVNPHDICEYQHNHEHKTIPGPIEQGIASDAQLPPLPSNFHYDERETAMQQVARRGENPLFHSAILNGIQDWTELQWRFMIWNHYRFTEAADRQIELMINALDSSRFRDNTLIIFSVDHGESNGSHRMFQKFTLYEESIHVPFIITDLNGAFLPQKGIFDQRHFVSGVDFAPTVLDYAGVDVPHEVQGRSLRPLVEGSGNEGWREFAYVESNFWARAIVTDRYKYIMDYRPNPDDIGTGVIPPGPDTHAVGSEALFDIESDHGETNNLAANISVSAVVSSALADCRQKLFGMERRLNRRPYRKDSEAARLLAFWDKHPGFEL